MTEPTTRAVLVAFERYFRWADQMRIHYTAREADYPDERKAHWEPYMAYWYGGLYTVVEGWQELGLSDTSIDELLEHEQNVDLLRRYQNGAFHFQPDYFDERFVKVWAADSTVPWIRTLHGEFTRWFEKDLPKIIAATFTDA